ncbi:GIP, partial [Symbiodinium microadriaticum]
GGDLGPGVPRAQFACACFHWIFAFSVVARNLLLRAKAEAAATRADAAEVFDYALAAPGKEWTWWLDRCGNAPIEKLLWWRRRALWVGLDILLRGYKGKHFLDASQETPGPDMMEDVSPAQVQAVPPRGELAGRSDKDAWELREGMLVRKHRAMRLTLFTPARMKDTPVLEEHLSGQRRTVMQQPGGAHVINDDYKLAEKPTRSMMERWRGETQFEILPEFRKLYGPSAEASASSALEEQPRKFARTLRDGASSAASSRPQRLQDPLDDLPVPSPPERLKDPIDDLPVPSPPERLQDPVDDLPAVEGQLPPQPEYLEEEHASAAPYSTSEESDSEEELIADGMAKQAQYIETPAQHHVYACEIDVGDKDLRRLRKKPQKAAVWLSQKMMEKSKEVSWRSLDESQKKEYDEAMAVEVTNVVRESAIRALTKQELASVDPRQVMSMRWVLTRKQSGLAKARLVVLGYQMPGIENVKTASPTLSRTVRNVMLSVSSHAGFALESGDVTRRLIGIAGVHVDDFLIAGDLNDEGYVTAKAQLQAKFRFGKWDSAAGEGFTFAGCRVWQDKHGIHLDQEEYIREWVQEIPLSSARANEWKSSLTAAELSELRGVLGTLSWKASQTGPLYQSAVSLKLSEIPHATIKTILEVNKLVRKVRRQAKQKITFPAWRLPWQQMSTVGWADASQGNRPNKSSTIGFMACYGPREIADGEEVQLAMVA